MKHIDRERLQTLVPQTGRMCLLDSVTDHDAQRIVCVARSHRDLDNPLRRDDWLSAVHLIEYAAQAMAAHGALTAGGAAQPGMIGALRDIKLHVERIDTLDADLSITATRRLAQRDGSLYDFQVHASEQLLGEGRIAIAFT